MIAVDTNVVVRLFAADDPEQTAAARLLFSEETVFISRTVLLEFAWVLRSAYKLPPERVLDALTSLLGLEGVRVEDAAKVADAIHLGRTGMDVADALHVAVCPEDATFVTFERAIGKVARRAGSRFHVRLL